MATINKLISDEHQAVRDYGETARKARKKKRPEIAKVMLHIQPEEKEHARELTQLKTRVRKQGKSVRF